jgi:hypothetical protein
MLKFVGSEPIDRTFTETLMRQVDVSFIISNYFKNKILEQEKLLVLKETSVKIHWDSNRRPEFADLCELHFEMAVVKTSLKTPTSQN